MRHDLPLRYCRYRGNCNAKIKGDGYTLCCRYGWCPYAQPSQDRKGKKAQQDNFKMEAEK